MQATEWGAIIDKLADKLSVPAAQLWTVLVRQGRIDAIEAGVWVALGVTTLGYLGTRGFRRVKAWVDEDGAYTDRDTIWLPFGFVALAALIVVAVHLPVLATGLFNPEFLALKHVLNAAR